MTTLNSNARPELSTRKAPLFRALRAVPVVVGCLAAPQAWGQVCGMWAGPLSVELTECDAPIYTISGQGQDIGCGGPGHWPALIIRNITAGTETSTDWFQCGGCNCEYSFKFHPKAPEYAVGDQVMFLRANRDLGQLPKACEESGPTIIIAESPCECPADCDGSGGLDVFDFLCFTNRFNAGDAAADCDGDGALDLFDFLCFTSAFNEGC